MKTLKQQQSATKPAPESAPEKATENVQELLKESERQAKFNSLFEGRPEKAAKPATERQIFNNVLNDQVRGLGTWFSAVRMPENRERLLSFLADQKAKGKIFDKSKVETLLNIESKEAKSAGFNLFKQYLNDKEKEKTTFTANQVTGIFLRACLAE